MKSPTPSLQFFSPISGYAPACPVARSTLGIAGKQGLVLHRFFCQGRKMSHLLSPVDCLGGPDSQWWWDLAHRYLALPWRWVHFTCIILLLLLRSVQFNWSWYRFFQNKSTCKLASSTDWVALEESARPEAVVRVLILTSRAILPNFFLGSSCTNIKYI